jgi:hypothetical protein
MIVRTLWILTVAFVGIDAVIEPAKAQYEIELRGEASANQYSFRNESTFFFNPGMQIDTTAVMTLTSPNGYFESYINHPEGNLGSFIVRSSTASVLEEANGTWELSIDDGATTHRYDIEISLLLPFAELPYFTSSTLVTGQPVGPFSWTLVGGEAAYPTGGASISASLWTAGFGETLDQALLPIDAATWTPNANLTRPEGYVGAITTRSEPEEFLPLSVLSITPLTDGAPDVAFTLTSMRYRAGLTADLEPSIVPEPSAAVLTLLAVAGLVSFRRRATAVATGT